ncbi:hypothetical protein QYF61_016760 [Mycteria americana]|uniref:Uncharacterized protein n=1 Tax=Mycteria americana TaxID=33587 RepID=A0AAN7S7V7_MYCAM|nr:hypothetical protein QYF61_016760 [Mycteria americana]
MFSHTENEALKQLTALGGRTAALRDLNMLEKQGGRNIMEFSNGKCEVPHLDWNNPMQQHGL